MTLDTIKACPFCGCYPDLIQTRLKSAPRKSGSWSLLCPNAGCSVKPQSFPRKTREEAEAEWNRRQRPRQHGDRGFTL